MNSPPLLLVIIIIIIFILSSLDFTTSISSSSILFTTNGRSRYAFDIFAVPITPSPTLTLTIAGAELRLTDGISVNYNGFFTTTNSLLYVSERGGSSNIYPLSSPTSSSSSSNPRRRESREEAAGLQQQQLIQSSPLLPTSVFAMRDRPSLAGDRHLVYVSTHVPSPSPRRSSAAVYSTDLPTGLTRRLSPPSVSDFSPSVSPSGLWTAVASSDWAGEIQELNTSIYIFTTLDGSRRTLLLEHGGWPCWGHDDSTLYFHRRSSGWWSVYRAVVVGGINSNPIVASVDRITPPGFHAFTPSAAGGVPGLIAVATRRPGSDFRHVELIDLRGGGGGGEGRNLYLEVTRPISPNTHHYNPFIAADGSRIGYHRCRGGVGGGGGSPPLLLESIRSPSPETLSLFRIDGSFPSFSPDGSRIAYVRLPGLYVVNSDGSGEPREVLTGNAFPTAWDWKREVIYTSYGPDFASEGSSVDIISIALPPADDGNAEPVIIKKLTLGEENNAFPSPSPDGKWVVFRSGRSGHKNLYIMDAVQGEAAGIRRLTEGPWTDTMCNWSPDGDWIAFASDRHDPGAGSFAIYMVHPNGTGLRMAVHSGEGGRTNHPWFSPDSKSLVFTSDYAGVSAEPISNPHHYQPYGDIFTAKIDGSDIRRLTHNSYEDGTPTWSPYFLNPADVAESLHGNALCEFDDCHWLTLQPQHSNNVAFPGSSSC